MIDDVVGDADLEVARRSSAPWWSADAPMSQWMPPSEYVQLVYLTNLLWQPLIDPTASLWDWVAVLVIVVTFVPLWILSHHPDRRVRRFALVATVVLGVVATPVNVGAAVLFVYASASAAWLDRQRLVPWQVGLTLLCVVLTVVSPVPFPFRLYAMLPVVMFIWMIGWLVQADARRSEHAQRLRVDNVRIEQLATANERERIARDLHDLVGQSLTGLVVKAQLVQGLLPDHPEQAAVQAADLEGGARDALAQVRTAIDGLGQVSLEDELDTAARSLEAAGVGLEVHGATAATSTLGPLVERILALAVREATTNVIRHASAHTCTIDLEQDATRWRVDITDDGVGGAAPDGNGLRGMRERVMAVGGTVHRTGRDGTRITIEVPA